MYLEVKNQNISKTLLNVSKIFLNVSNTFKCILSNQTFHCILIFIKMYPLHFSMFLVLLTFKNYCNTCLEIQKLQFDYSLKSTLFPKGLALKSRVF